MPKIGQGEVTLKEGVDYDTVNGEIVLRAGAKSKLKTTAPKFKAEHVGKFIIREASHYHRRFKIAATSYGVYMISRETPGNLYFVPVDRNGKTIENSGSPDSIVRPGTSKAYSSTKLPAFFDLNDAWSRCDRVEKTNADFEPKLNAAKKELERLSDEKRQTILKLIGRE